jgi:hypothetical protein
MTNELFLLFAFYRVDGRRFEIGVDRRALLFFLRLDEGGPFSEQGRFGFGRRQSVGRDGSSLSRRTTTISTTVSEAATEANADV